MNIDDLAKPGPDDIRMDAYYYSFNFTGVAIIDKILSEVATAGKAFHSTEEWGPSGWMADEGEPTYAERIQIAANEAASAIRQAARRFD